MRSFAWSLAVGVLSTVLIGTLASLPGLSLVGILLVPGMLIAAAVFPQGINSNWGYTYLVIAGLVNAFILAWLLFWLWTAIGRWQKRRR